MDMGNPVPGWIFGGFLTVLGIAMLYAQKTARSELASQQLRKHEERFLRNRVRRRMQVAGMILLIGIMIPVGDSLIPWKKNTVATWAVYWIIVLILALWTMLLGFADMAATRMHSSVEISQLERRQKDLEQIAQQLREEQAKRGESS